MENQIHTEAALLQPRLVMPSLSSEEIEVLKLCAHPWVTAAHLVMTSPVCMRLIELEAVKVVRGHEPEGHRITGKGADFLRQNTSDQIREE